MSDESVESAEVEAPEAEESEAPELSFEEQLAAASEQDDEGEEEDKEEEPKSKKAKVKAKEVEEGEEDLRSQVKGLVGVKKHQAEEISRLSQTVEMQNERLAEMVNALNAMRQNLEPEEFEEKETDESMLDRKLQPLLEAEETREMERAVSEASSFVTDHWNQTKESFTAEHEDFPEAAAWLAERDVADFRAQNPTATDAEVSSWWQDHLLTQRVSHARARTSMPEVVYRRALALGFEPGKAPPKPASKVDTVRHKIEKTKAPARSRTPASPTITAADIANFEQEDWDNLLDQGMEKALSVVSRGRSAV